VGHHHSGGHWDCWWVNVMEYEAKEEALTSKELINHQKGTKDIDTSTTLAIALAGIISVTSLISLIRMIRERSTKK
jgi:hypothetical protein